MTAKTIEGWICVFSGDMRVASRGAASASYEPGEALVVTCDSTGIVKIPAAVVKHLTDPVSSRDAFHTHLDGCPRCTKRPFDLCAEGSALLAQAAK